MPSKIPDRLKPYRAKRDFARTSEPRPRTTKNAGHQFVVQKHDARRLHFDLRLELDGVLLSWACPNGPSNLPTDKRLAVRTEDHPLKYLDFEGVIPKGEYGGGTMIVWDRGVWAPVHDPHKRAVERQLVLKELLAAEQLIAEAVRGRHFRGSRSLKQGAYALQ